MTERDIKRMSDLLEENNLVSATDCTGAAPRAMDEDAAETIADITDMRCSPSFAAEDPAHSPLQGGNPGLHDAFHLHQRHADSPRGKASPN